MPKTPQELNKEIEVLTQGYDETYALCKKEQKVLDGILNQQKKAEIARDAAKVIESNYKGEIKKLQAEEAVLKQSIADLPNAFENRHEEIQKAYLPLEKELQSQVNDKLKTIGILDKQIVEKTNILVSLGVYKGKEADLVKIKNEIIDSNNFKDKIEQDADEAINKIKEADEKVKEAVSSAKEVKEGIKELESKKGQAQNEVTATQKDLDKVSKELLEKLKGGTGIAQAIANLNNEKASVKQILAILNVSPKSIK